MELGAIAQVSPGYAFRKAIEPDENGDAFVLQAKDLPRESIIVNTSTLVPISFDQISYTEYLQPNDVLLTARGMKAGSFRSAVFGGAITQVVASTSIYIIRVTSSNVLPEYLSYYLNSKQGQDNLSQIVTGSYIGAIPRRLLIKMQIPLPSTTKQEAIVDLYNNVQAQQKLLERSKILRQQIAEAAFTKLTHEQYE